MQNELNDSLLSAYLDDQLTGEERAAVEARLRDSAEHRQALAELQQLRESFQALPRYELGDDFASRVIAAAVAAEAQQDTANEPARMPVAPVNTPVERAPASRNHRRLAYVAGAIAAVAACLLVIVQFGPFGRTIEPVADTLETVDQLENQALAGADEVALPSPAVFASLRQSLPGEGEALIVRVRVPAGTNPAKALDEAMAQSGIRQLTASDPTSAGRVGAAYRTALRAQGSQESPPVTEDASDALYVEAPLGLVEDALALLADQDGGKLELRPEMTVAVAASASNRSAGEGEGESGSASEQAVSQEPFAQRLNPRMFKLPKDADNANDTPVSGGGIADPNRKVRVLILVETVE